MREDLDLNYEPMEKKQVNAFDTNIFRIIY